MNLFVWLVEPIPISLKTVYTYSDELYELCPVCNAEEDECNWCDNLGFIPHDC